MTARPVRWIAANGTPLVMRVARASDTAQVKTSLDKLSPEARRNRFFSPMPGFSDALVKKLTDVDPAREHVLLVMRRENGIEFPVGGGRFVVLEDEYSRFGEFALVVGDLWQGQGIGQRIMTGLLGEARRRKLSYLYGHVLSDNHKMLDFVRHLGFRIEPGDDASLRRVVIDLPPVASWRHRLTRLLAS